MNLDRGNRLGCAQLAFGNRIDPLPTMRSLCLLLLWKALLLCITLAATSSAFAGLLQDPGFDLPSGSPWGLSETEAFIRTPWVGHPNYTMPYAGPRVLQLEANAGMLGSMAFARQSLAATGQQEWTFSGHMLNYDNTAMKQGSYGLLEIVFTGSAFGEKRFSSDPFAPDPKTDYSPQNWSLGSVSAVAPAGTEQVTFYVKIVQGEVLDTGYGSIWWDEMNATVLEPVPELASTGWVAVLIVGLAIGGQQLRSRRAAEAKVPVSL